MGAAPPGYGTPLPGYPQPGQSRSNGFAIASLVCGIIGCLLVTSLAAIVFGALGIRKANREPQSGGKGMAIAGTSLAVMWLLIVGLFGGGIWAMMAGNGPQQEVGRSFVRAISAGGCEDCEDLRDIGHQRCRAGDAGERSTKHGEAN